MGPTNAGKEVMPGETTKFDANGGEKFLSTLQLLGVPKGRRKG